MKAQAMRRLWFIEAAFAVKRAALLHKRHIRRTGWRNSRAGFLCRQCSPARGEALGSEKREIGQASAVESTGTKRAAGPASRSR